MIAPKYIPCSVHKVISNLIYNLKSYYSDFDSDEDQDCDNETDTD